MNVTLICPLYEAGMCLERGCNGHLSRPQFEKNAINGDELYSGSCPSGWKMFHNLPACATPMAPPPVHSEQKAQSVATKVRGKGVCEFSGDKVHPHIFITPGKSLKVKTKLYSFDRASEWEIINRFFRSYVDCDDHSKGNFPTPFTRDDYNKTHGDCRLFIDTYVERQPAARRIGNKRFEPYARLKIELI